MSSRNLVLSCKFRKNLLKIRIVSYDKFGFREPIRKFLKKQLPDIKDGSGLHCVNFFFVLLQIYIFFTFQLQTTFNEKLGKIIKHREDILGFEMEHKEYVEKARVLEIQLQVPMLMYFKQDLGQIEKFLKLVTL